MGSFTPDLNSIAQGAGAQPQQQPQAQQPDPNEQALRQSLVQQATPPPERRSGGIKGLLTNFMQGFGNAAMKEAGLPTQYDIQQRALQNLNTYDNNQAMLKLHQNMAQQLQLQPVQLPDGSTVHVAQKDVAGLLNRMMQSASAANVAHINQGIPVNTSPEMQNLLGPNAPAQIPSKQANTLQGIITKQQGQIPITDEMRQILPSLPASVTSIPAQSFMRAAVMMAPQTRQSFEWKETSPGTWEPLPTTSVTTKGRAGAAPGSPQSQNAPARPAMPNKVYGSGAIYATDPSTGDTIPTTPQEAAQKGYINQRKVTQGQMAQDQQLSNRLVDVATKMNRYEAAINEFASTGGFDKVMDRTFMSSLLSSDKMKLGAFGAEVPVDKFNQIIDSMHATNLSDQARKALIAYYNARESIQGYQRVLSGSGHSSELGMNLNLAALPSPVMPQNMVTDGIGQFKENLPIAARGVPTTPGQQSVRDILNQGPSGKANPTGGFAAWKAKQK